MDEKLINFEANFSVLDRYGEDITANTYITNPAIGRDEEIKELILVLLTPEKSAILIGKPGIGKTAIVEGLAYRIQKGDVPEALIGYKIINLKTASLLGTMPSGESKVQKMIDELKKREKVILFIDEIHMLIGSTDSSSLDFANIFKEGLGRGSIKVIGATTTEEYERYILRDKAFTRRFQKIEVPEPNREETIKIMMGTLPKFEQQTGRKMKYTPFIQERIMGFIVDITSEYKRVFALGSRYPDVCLTLLKQAFSYTVYDNRDYMDIFDIRKAIENSKNIYPDVIKKELPNFDKMFNDIISEEKGEKPVEEWRRESGPTRYEQENNANVLTKDDNKSKEDSINEKLKIFDSMPKMVDVRNIKEEMPVKTILNEKSLNKFAKIGPTAISRGLKDRFNQKNDTKHLDDLLLSSKIEVISDDKPLNNTINFKYSAQEDLNPKRITDLLLGNPIESTIDDYNKEEKKDSYVYKSDNNYDKEINLNTNNLILDNQVGKDNNKKYTEEVSMANFNDLNIFNNNKKDVFMTANRFQNNSTEVREKNNNSNVKDGFLFGAPMYSEEKDKEKEKSSRKTTDIFGQLILPESNMRIENGQFVDESSNLDKSPFPNSHSVNNKKWEFIDVDGKEKDNKEKNFNELNIKSNTNQINDNSNFPTDNFINFSDLNSGKISLEEVNNLNVNRNVPKVDLTLDENIVDNDNYFDDFYE